MGARAEQQASTLDQSCREVNAAVERLSDAELDRSGTLLVGTPSVTAAQAIQEILIDHVYEHLESIKATTKAK